MDDMAFHARAICRGIRLLRELREALVPKQSTVESRGSHQDKLNTQSQCALHCRPIDFTRG